MKMYRKAAYIANVIGRTEPLITACSCCDLKRIVIITDKEVGELWRRCIDSASDLHWDTEELLKKLIRKLVEERARYHRTNPEVGDWSDMNQALRDFGIDPETWHQ